MITNEAISLAQEIVEAQKKADIDHVEKGVFVYNGNGKYDFYALKDVYFNGEPFGVYLDLQNEKVATNRLRIEMLEKENENAFDRIIQLEKDVEVIKESLKQLATYFKQEGEVL